MKWSTQDCNGVTIAHSRLCRFVVGCSVCWGMTGCMGLPVPERNSSAALGLAVMAVNPSTDIEQVYYLGSFDPRGQFPPSIYRIRVRGQSSILNSTRFASSWVPAEVVDALTGQIGIDPKNGKVSIEQNPSVRASLSDAGRGLLMFGPEGVREAPRGHRLVVIMGASPETVEQAFASALGTVAQVKFGVSGSALDKDLFALLLELGQEREQLKGIEAER
jgi:hypothetical protein